jgi:hypothetical protein
MKFKIQLRWEYSSVVSVKALAYHTLGPGFNSNTGPHKKKKIKVENSKSVEVFVYTKNNFFVL